MRLLITAVLVAGTLSGVAQTITPIGQIQTAGATAAAGTYTIEGIVTAVYAAWAPAGFFVQNDAATADGDPATSDAIFVLQRPPGVLPGDRVRITGTVQESIAPPANGIAVVSNPSISVLASGQPLPLFTVLDNTTFRATQDAERVEGMRVQFSGPLTVTDAANLRTSGELTLSVRGPALQPTQIIDPNDALPNGTTSTGATNVAAVQAQATDNAAKLLILDDGSAANGPRPIPYADPVSGIVRVGSEVAPLRGIMSFANNRWRVQPLPGPDAPLVTSQRPAVPTFSAAPDLRLASFNVLNYFNGDGAGGGFPTSRGARTPVDFRRQRAKILRALAMLDADAVGLMEIENDGTGPASAIQDLVNGLNGLMGAGTYAFVDDGATRQLYGSDLIRCALLYKPARLIPVGGAILGADPVFNRPPLAQVFIGPTGDTVALVVNHFKSKGSGSGVNADQGDGQGRSNYLRRLQAAALVQFLQGPVTAAGGRHFISVGDYNAHYEEDPIDVLRAAGFGIPTDPTEVSYVYNGLAGALDHAVVSPSLAGKVLARHWNINAQEPYYLEYTYAGAVTDTLSPYRSSDHDPVLVGVRFAGFPVGLADEGTVPQLLVYPNPAAGGFRVKYGSDIPAGLTLDVLDATGRRIITGLHPAALEAHTARLSPGGYWLRASAAGRRQMVRVVKE